MAISEIIAKCEMTQIADHSQALNSEEKYQIITKHFSIELAAREWGAFVFVFISQKTKLKCLDIDFMVGGMSWVAA
jgi:hypothetical protein